MSGDWAAWVFTLYLLSGAVLTPVLARFGDRRGKRRVLLGSLAVFGAGTVLAALARNFPVLLLARAMQGVRTVGGVIGTQVAVAILSAHSVAGSALPSEGAFTVVFALGAVFAAVGVAVVLLLPRTVTTR